MNSRRMLPARSIGRMGLALAGALVMTAALPLSAQAATGQLTLTRDDGSVSVISNPRDGRCYSLRGAGAARVANDTDSTAFVYMDSGCSGLVSRVDAGETWEKSGTQAADSIVLFQP